jgi:hypothetical protein
MARQAESEAQREAERLKQAPAPKAEKVDTPAEAGAVSVGAEES